MKASRFSSFLFLTLLLTALAFLSPGCKPKKKPSSDPKIVYVRMIADLFHPGHVAFLKQAKAEGNYLIVGLFSDRDAERFVRLPIMPLKERKLLVESCRWVDQVIENCPINVTDSFLDEHSIDLVIHGDDLEYSVLQQRFGSAISRSIFKVIPYSNPTSTTDIIKRILHSSSLKKTHLARAKSCRTNYSESEFLRSLGLSNPYILEEATTSMSAFNSSNR